MGTQNFFLIVNKERKERHPFVKNDMDENHEDDEVNFVLPLKFDEQEEQEDDDEKSACEAFIILGSLQKFELKRVEITQGFEQYLIQEECPYHQ